MVAGALIAILAEACRIQSAQGGSLLANTKSLVGAIEDVASHEEECSCPSRMRSGGR